MRFALLPVAVWLALYAPGHYFLRPHESGARGSRLFRELLLSACCTSWIGLVLAELGLYSLPTLFAGLAFVATAGVVITRVHPARPYARLDAAALIVIVFTWFWVAPPMDTRILGADSAGYLAGGIHLSRHGTMIIHDPTLSLLSPDLKRSLFQSVTTNPGAPPYLRLAGSLVLRSLDGDEVLPAFHPLIAVWIAIFQGLAGPASPQWVVTLFAGLAVWAIAEFTLGLAGGMAAAAVCLLLWLCAPQDWYSRFLMPEVPAQFFLWGGLALLLSWSRDGQRADAWGAGAAFGIAGLMRIENAPFLLVALTVGFGLAARRQRRPVAALAVPALLLWSHALAHLLVFRTHYFGNMRTVFVETLAPLWHGPWATLALATAVLGGLALWRLRPALRAGRESSILPVLIVAVLTALWADWHHGWSSIQLLTAYVGVGTVILGSAALVGYASVDGGIGVSAFLLLAAIVFMQFMLAPHATPVPIWAIRRAVTIIVPACCIGVVLGCRALARRGGVAVAVLAFSLALLPQLPRWLQLRREPYYQQAWRHIQALATLLPPGACLIFDADLAGSGLAPALWAERDVPAYLVSRYDLGRLATLFDALRNVPLFWIDRDSAPPPRLPGVVVTPVALYQFVLRTPALEIGSAPGASATWDSAIAVYALRPASQPAALSSSPAR